MVFAEVLQRKNSVILRKRKKPTMTRICVTWIVSMLLAGMALGQELRCGDGEVVPLGLESNTIPDSRMIASSAYNDQYGETAWAWRGRLNYEAASSTDTGAWAAHTSDANQWIQVDLGVPYRLVALATQGRQDYYEWVTSYKVECSMDGVTFDTVQHNSSSDVVFPANSDRDTVVHRALPAPLVCRFVRVRPVTWYGRVSMRMELYGNGPIEDIPLGLESGTISDSSLTASSEHRPDSYGERGARWGRLNVVRYYERRIGWDSGWSGAGAWSVGSNDANPWIQVDLGSAHRVFSLATQGRQDADEWVKTYMVAYSMDGVIFDTVQSMSGSAVVFSANYDRDTVVRNAFPTPLVCRFVRVLPVYYKRHISMRMELYGYRPVDCN